METIESEYERSHDRCILLKIDYTDYSVLQFYLQAQQHFYAGLNR